LSELALAAGGIGGGSVTMAVKRIEQRSNRDKRLLAAIETATAQL
jgi:hypothetical protein